MLYKEIDGCVVLDTSLGPLVIDLLTRASNKSVRNFLCLVHEGFYDGDVFHVLHHGRFTEFGRLWKNETKEVDNLLSTMNPNIYIDTSDDFQQGETVEELIERCPNSFQGGFESIQEHDTRASACFGSVFASQVSPNREGARMRIALCSDKALLKSFYQSAGSHVGIIRDGLGTLSRFNSEENVPTDIRGKPVYHIQIRNARVVVQPSLVPSFHNTESWALLDSRILSSLCKAIVHEHSKYIMSSGIQYDDQFRNISETFQSHESKYETKMRSQETLMKVMNTKRERSRAHPGSGLHKDRTLFVCRLNPLTSEDDLRIFFSQFGKISRCILVCDKNTGDSLNYGFIEYHEINDCLNAYKKTEGIVIGDRHIHVDFYQGGNKY